MRIREQHIDVVWPELLEEAIERGYRESASQDSIRDLTGTHVVLDGSAEQFCLNPMRKLSAIYASAELLWYLSRTHEADMIAAYAPSYLKFCEDNLAYGAYGGRLAQNLINEGTFPGEDSLDTAIDFLRKRPTTKKCVVSLWKPTDLLMGYHSCFKDIPCTISWQFVVRGEKLHMICSMRSNDLWKGFLYDCYVNTVIQRYVASQLGLVAGEYHHISGSTHLYEKDVQRAQACIIAAKPELNYGDGLGVECLRAPSWMRSEDRYHPSACGWNDSQLAYALQSEKAFRVSPESAVLNPKSCSVLCDAVICCASKWIDVEEEVRAPGLRKGLSNAKRRVVDPGPCETRETIG